MVIGKLTAKWTIVASMFCYSTYIVVQFYPTFYTLVPAAVIVGLAGAPFWGAKCLYMAQLGRRLPNTLYQIMC